VKGRVFKEMRISSTNVGGHYSQQKQVDPRESRLKKLGAVWEAFQLQTLWEQGRVQGLSSRTRERSRRDRCEWQG